MGRVLKVNGQEIYHWDLQNRRSVYLNGTYRRNELIDMLKELIKEDLQDDDVLEQIAVIAIVLQLAEDDVIEVSNN